MTHADLLPAKGGAGRGEAKGAAVEAIGGAIGGEQEKVQQLEQALARSVAQRRSDYQRRSVRPLRNIPNSNMAPVSKATSLRSAPTWKDGATR